MKIKILMLLLLVAVVINAQSQWNTTISGQITTSDKVGIGTSNPEGYLHINPIRPIIIKNNGGNGVYGSEIGFNSVLLTSSLPNQFKKLGGTSQAGGANMAVDYNGNILFQMYGAGTENESIVNYAPQITFRNNGNIGIGIVSPTNALSVYRDTGAKIDITSNQSTSESGLWFRVNQSGKDGAIIYRNDGRLSFNLDASNASGVDNNEYMTILRRSQRSLPSRGLRV